MGFPGVETLQHPPFEAFLIFIKELKIDYPIEKEWKEKQQGTTEHWRLGVMALSPWVGRDLGHSSWTMDKVLSFKGHWVKCLPPWIYS